MQTENDAPFDVFSLLRIINNTEQLEARGHFLVDRSVYFWDMDACEI